MAGFNLLPFKFFRKKTQSNLGINPLRSQQPVVLKSPAAPSQSKSITALEREMEAEAQYVPTRPHKQLSTSKPKRQVLRKIIWAALLIGVPVGIVWVANLPYAVIQRPVARTAPLLLLPSYISIDNHYKQAIASVEQAQQLIENPTSPADIDLGAQKVKEAQAHLNALPISLLNDWTTYQYWWYDWRYSPSRFNAARAKIGELDAKVFQEKNAQTLLTDNEQTLLKAKQQYQQAKTPTDTQLAITAWRSAIDQLGQIPSVTLAGRTAQAKLDSYQRDFKEVVGLVAGNELVSTLIVAAQQFSWEAAKAGQNPPHTVDEWTEVEKLWQQAIDRLAEIPEADLAGYAKAQELQAEYSRNLGQIKVRRQAEESAVISLTQAQRQIEQLIASTPSDANSVDRNRTVSELQGIINKLERVPNSTTVYLKAQNLLLFAQNKLNQF